MAGKHTSCYSKLSHCVTFPQEKKLNTWSGQDIRRSFVCSVKLLRTLTRILLEPAQSKAMEDPGDIKESQGDHSPLAVPQEPGSSSGWKMPSFQRRDWESIELSTGREGGQTEQLLREDGTLATAAGQASPRSHLHRLSVLYHTVACP